MNGIGPQRLGASKGCGCGCSGASPMKKKSGPCWKGYEAVGMKNKGGKKVPNCVPKKK